MHSQSHHTCSNMQVSPVSWRLPPPKPKKLFSMCTLRVGRPKWMPSVLRPLLSEIWSSIVVIVHLVIRTLSQLSMSAIRQTGERVRVLALSTGHLCVPPPTAFIPMPSVCLPVIGFEMVTESNTTFLQSY